MKSQRDFASGCITLYFSLTSALYCGGQGHAPAALFSRNDPSIHFTGGLMGLSFGLDRYRKLSPQQELEPRTDKTPPILSTL